jgi:hypothetical protein
VRPRTPLAAWRISRRSRRGCARSYPRRAAAPCRVGSPRGRLVAIMCGSRRPSVSDAASRNQTPSGYSSRSSSATRNASRVLPTPGTPVKVTSRSESNRCLISIRSTRRPTRQCPAPLRPVADPMLRAEAHTTHVRVANTPGQRTLQAPVPRIMVTLPAVLGTARNLTRSRHRTDEENPAGARIMLVVFRTRRSGRSGQIWRRLTWSASRSSLKLL